MPATPRAPSFLAGSASPQALRPVPFGVPGGAARSRPSAAGPRDLPPAPSPEQLAALRAEALQKVAHAVEVLRLQAERLAEQARADALEIGFRVAKRVVEAELSTSPAAFFSLVRSALRRTGESRRVSVRVHPQDAAALAPAVARGELGVATATVEVVPDPSLARGDCLVDTDFGNVDGRLQTRLEELFRAASAAVEEDPA